MHNLLNYIVAFGYVGITLTVFAESGILLGFFLPGDSLLFTAGILAAQGYFNIYYLIGLCVVAAIAGDSFGYYLGHRFGSKLFDREDSLVFKKKYVETTEHYFAKYGVRTIVLARFIPIVRTFAPVMAGVGQMKYRTFLTFNIVGGIIWAGGLLSVSYILGLKFKGIDGYLNYIIIAIILISVVPMVFEYFRRK